MAEACFVFSIGRSKDLTTGAHVFSCTYRDEDGRVSERCDVPIPETEWQVFLRFAGRCLPALPDYAPPDLHLLDAADSKIEIIWEADGTRRMRCFDGEHAAEFAAYLRALAKRTRTP